MPPKSMMTATMVSNRFKKLTVDVNAQSDKVKNKVADKIVQSAKKLHAPHIFTGETYDSIQKTEGLGGGGFGVEAGGAALFLEFGTVKMPAYPFLGPAAAENRDGFNKYYTEMFVGLEPRYPPTPPF
jgi:HK97 gp10 family phage protein